MSGLQRLWGCRECQADRYVFADCLTKFAGEIGIFEIEIEMEGHLDD